MGSLVYATGRPDAIHFDDRTLAHLQIVIGAKLRLRQSFFFSWLDSVDIGGGRGSIWLDATIPLAFSYAKSERQRINREWLELLMASANSSVGLQLMAEPIEPPIAVEKVEKAVLVQRAWSSADNLVST
jgi:hypothetical protein